jgi:hypothetical protein
MMRAKQFAIALSFAGAYMLLIWILIGYTAAIDTPDWWYPTFGRTGPSAIAWMQTVHTLGVVAAAIPVAAGIVHLSRPQPMRIAYVAAGLAMAAMLYDVGRGYYLIAQFPTAVVEPRQVVSSAIDVVKVGLLLLVAVWAWVRVVPSNYALERP